MKYYLPTLTLLLCMLIACSITTSKKPKEPLEASELPLDKIKLPPGFQISVFADKVTNARSMSLSPNGTLFVGTRKDGRVYAIRDEDGDFKADKTYTLDRDLFMPTGVAFRNGSLYVAEVNRILRYDDIENRLDNPPEPVVVYDQYPDDKWHGWKYIAFGPDDKLYVPVGAPCNVCDGKAEVYATMTRMNPDGTNMEIYAKGVRNSVGFDWHPETGDLWFTENGRDWMGEDMPACELNHAPKAGMHFGFPYCHQGDAPDDKFAGDRTCEEFTPPAQKLGPHVAPLGMEFYEGAQFPAKYKHQILVAEHGSWNRKDRIGYRVMLVGMEGNKTVSYEPFAEGWMENNENPWGRPVDLEHLPDGSMLVSDDFADAIYRISYDERRIGK